MSEPIDPPRWSSDGRAPPSVRDALRGARGYRPSPAQVEAVTEAVTRAVGAPAAAPLGAAALSARAKLLLGALVAVSAAAWIVTRGRDAPGDPPAHPAVVARSAPVEVARAAPVGVADAAPRSPDDAAVVVTDDAGASARRAPGCVEREHDARVAAAQAALRDGDAARALALSNQDKARCPRGRGAEDRERVAIESLARLGRREEASARWGRFRGAFPDSLYTRRLRAVLGEAP